MKVISGGQTGCDLAALHAAREAGLETGGWIPRGFLTEDGPRPELAEYGLKEMPTADYPARTRRNIEDCDGVLIVARGTPTGGTALTIGLTKMAKKPSLVIRLDTDTDWPWVVWQTACWIGDEGIRTLNVAGPRESKTRGIYKAAHDFLLGVFRAWKESEAGS